MYYMERVEANRIMRINKSQRINMKTRNLRSRNVRSHRRLITIIIFLLILIVGLLSCKAFVHADEQIEQGRTKSFKSVVIYSGDDINKIALSNITPEYSSPAAYIDEICFMNHISIDETLIPGNYLVVPTYM